MFFLIVNPKMKQKMSSTSYICISLGVYNHRKTTKYHPQSFIIRCKIRTRMVLGKTIELIVRYLCDYDVALVRSERIVNHFSRKKKRKQTRRSFRRTKLE